MSYVCRAEQYIMSELQLLGPSAQLKFNACPKFADHQRHIYFSINADTEKYLEKIRSPINKIGFVLQLGYFRASGKFFENELFRPADIKFVCNILGISLPSPNLDSKMYIANARYVHKNYILKISGWQKFTKKHYNDLHAELSLQAKQQMHPKPEG